MEVNPGIQGGAEYSRHEPRVSRLSLTFAPDPQGRTFLARQFASYPFHVCKVLYDDADRQGMGTIYTQSSAGGLFEHDRHLIEIVAGEGAEAHVTTQASTIVHSMKGGVARQTTTINAGAASFLEVLPDPQILFPKSSYEGISRIRMAEGATCIVSDSFLTHDPMASGGMPQHYRNEIIVENGDGRAIAIDRLHIDEQTFHNSAPGVAGRFKACGTMLVLFPRRACSLDFSTIADVTPDGTLIGTSVLPSNAGHLFRILAVDGVQLKRSMFACWSVVRTTMTGRAPIKRRK
jgi:urease accessory protein